MEREIIYDISVLEYVLFCIEGIAKKAGKRWKRSISNTDRGQRYIKQLYSTVI